MIPEELPAHVAFNADKKILKDLLDQALVLSDKIANHKAFLCQAYAKVSIGDVVEVNGYTHRGKKMRITNITLKKSSNGYQFKATGSILKKDGSTSLNHGDWFGERFEL